MKRVCSNNRLVRGAAMVESVMAMGVLAVAGPMVCGVMAEAWKCGLGAQADSRSAWIIPACMDELRASRDGCPRYLPVSTVGQAFPPEGEVWALAFSKEGALIGRLTDRHYETGVREVGGQAVSYLVVVQSSRPSSEEVAMPLLEVSLDLEYPSAAPAGRRRKLDFHTRMP